ncbi:nucleotidyltransferase-like protein [Cohnella panacarvi]|uniref:nucleotidyltransferase-like protein n=1 Tax=Cohnella panacarvi TaxID=400776 RepID=UPI00047DF910|nr:nucleotidyltransferase-like protein [Cohnella panacarvi]
MVRSDNKGLLYTEWFGDERGLIGLLLVANPYSYQPMINGMDRIAVLILNEVEPVKEIEHILLDGDRVQVRRLTPMMFESLLLSRDNHNAVQMLAQGEILLDGERYLAELRGRLIEWSPMLRDQKLLCEFSKFARTYLQAKQDIKDGQVLDAYANILSSLHYWAHIALIEEGLHPELTVWEQLRRVNPGVYKLFEELTTSQETLEQRVQLVLLACEFSVLTKMESCCALLIRIIASRQEPWSPAELLQHPDLAELSIDISLLLQKLTMRGCILEIARPTRSRGSGILELCYKVPDR